MNKILYAKYIKIATLILVGATFFAGAVLVSPISTAERVQTAKATVMVASTCSMTATVNTEHVATLVNGVYSSNYRVEGDTPYANGIGQTTLNTYCNDIGGYSIYAVGITGGTRGNTSLHSAALGSSYDIVTDTYDTTNTRCTGDTSDTDYSCWSMKVNAVASGDAPNIISGFDSFSAVPSKYTRVAASSNPTDMAGSGSSITTTYAAYVSNLQPAGTYVGQVAYVLVHPGVNVDDNNLVMQDVVAWDTSSWVLGEQHTAVDERDGKTYTVAKLADGNIWMTQNLDLCIGCEGVMALTSVNTDLNSYDTKGNGTGTVFTDYSYNSDYGIISWSPTAANTNATVTGTPAHVAVGGTAVTGWADNNNKPYMMEGGDTYSVQGSNFNSLSACEANGTRTEAECMHYHVGNYYNFSAAVAMSNTSSYNADKTVMPNSICPSGWRLPNGLTSDGTNIIQSDFNKLLTEYGIANGTDLTGGVNVGWKTNGFTNIGLAPLFFVRSGRVGGSALYYFGSNGFYWSSTVSSAALGYYLGYYSSELYPANRNYRYYGWSVRCIAR